MIESNLYLTELSKSTASNFFKAKQSPSSTVKTFYKTKKSSSSLGILSRSNFNKTRNISYSNNNFSFSIKKNESYTPKKNNITLKYRDLNIKDRVIRLKKQNKTLTQFKEEFLTFLIHEKTQFADLALIEQHYSKLIEKNYNTYNINKIIIKHKHNELQNVTYDITKTLFTYMNVNECNQLEEYDKEIEKLKRDIKIKQLENISYKHIYNRTYKTNYLLANRYQDEIQYNKILHEQHTKYKILKEHAVNTVSKQTEMLANIQKFKELNELSNHNQLSQKTKLFNHLEFEVLMIKKDTASIENALNIKINQQNKIKSLLMHRYLLNKKYLTDYLSYARDYHSTNMKLLNIYSILNVKNLFNVIKQFNVVKKQYNLLHFRFEQANYDIAKLNIQLTEMDKEIENINKQIEIKKKENLKPQDEVILGLMSQISTEKYFNEILEDSFKEKENLIKLMINYLNNYMLKILKSIQMSMLHCHFSTKSKIEKYQRIFSYDESFVNNIISLYRESDNHMRKQMRRKTTKKYTISNKELSDNNIKDTQKFKNLFKEFDKNLFIFVFNLFNDFIHDFFVLLSNVFNYVSLSEETYTNVNTDEEKLNNDNNITNESVDEINNQYQHKYNQHIEIVLFTSPSFQESVQKHTLLAITRQHDKLKILGRSEKDIFDSQKRKVITNQSDSDSSRNKPHTTISGKHLYKSYLHYINNIPSLNNKSTYYFVHKYPTRSVSVIGRYTNDLVDKNYEKNKLKEERRERILNRSNIIQDYIKNKELQRLLKLQKEKMDKIDRDEEEHDLDEEEYKNRTKIEYEKLHEEYQKGKRKTKFSMNTPNEQLNLIYMRLNDLRHLELKYFNNKDKDLINNQNLNEIFYNHKKKFYAHKFRKNGIKLGTRFHSVNARKSTNKMKNNIVKYSLEEKLPSFSQEKHQSKGSLTSKNRRNNRKIVFTSNYILKRSPSSN